MYMTLDTLASRIENLQNDDLLKSIVYNLTNIVKDCVFYNENVQFGSSLNRIIESIDYLESNYKVVDSMPCKLVVDCLRNEVKIAICEMNQLYNWASELSNPLFIV
jgi:hypothetical protein